MVAMKKLPAYIMVIALLVMNIASAAHADCAEGTVCGGIQAVVSIDDAGNDSGDQDKEQRNAACDCCATCGGHNHSQAVFFTGKAEHFATTSKMYNSQSGEDYFSQLHYPPSKPPKA